MFDPAYILTLRLDEASHSYFDGMRKRYFPPKRNHLEAHLTLFHKLPVSNETICSLEDFRSSTFEVWVPGLINLGNGVAYKVESAQLNRLHESLKTLFYGQLTAQDRQGFRSHVTIQNKVSSEQAKVLFKELSTDFKPFSVRAIGLDLWKYLGGPWSHQKSFLFKQYNL